MIFENDHGPLYCDTGTHEGLFRYTGRLYLNPDELGAANDAGITYLTLADPGRALPMTDYPQEWIDAVADALNGNVLYGRAWAERVAKEALEAGITYLTLADPGRDRRHTGNTPTEPAEPCWCGKIHTGFGADLLNGSERRPVAEDRTGPPVYTAEQIRHGTGFPKGARFQLITAEEPVNETLSSCPSCRTAPGKPHSPRCTAPEGVISDEC
jgi:hypothetical protein